jgi:hypothetical protein
MTSEASRAIKSIHVLLDDTPQFTFQMAVQGLMLKALEDFEKQLTQLEKQLGSK